MRTPGRCTNFQSCWLANGRRDIRVLVGDPFVCPVCGEPLHAPSMTSMSANGIVGALAVSLVLVATAGGAGFGLVRLAQTAITTTMAALHQQRSQPEDYAAMPQDDAAAGSQASGPGRDAAPGTVAQALAAMPVRTNPAQLVHVARLAGSVPVLKLDASVPPAVYVSATPPHRLVLPISFGRPHAPEDDAPARNPGWHHHGVRGAGTFARPAPGWSSDDDAAVSQAQQAVPPAEGDGDEDAGAAGNTTDNASAAAPGDSARPTYSSEPGQQSAAAPSAAIDVAGAASDRELAPAQITRLVVPAVVQASPGLAQSAAARIDPSAASEYDRAPDAPYRLSTLPAAAPAALAVPAYPAQAALAEQPGRVDVGCVITTRGVPAACQVQRQQGGQNFTHSVLTWLNSGSVRYRPGTVSGQPVAQPRDYKVSFQP